MSRVRIRARVRFVLYLFSALKLGFGLDFLGYD